MVRPSKAARAWLLAMACPAPRQMTEAMNPAHTMCGSDPGCDPERGAGPLPRARSAQRSTLPAQPATSRPLARRPVTPHTSDSRICPPSRGSAGRRLNRASSRLTQPIPPSTEPGHRPRTAWALNHPTKARSRFGQGPAAATAAARPGVSARESKAVWPPRKSATTRWTTSPSRRAIRACAPRGRERRGGAPRHTPGR